MTMMPFHQTEMHHFIDKNDTKQYQRKHYNHYGNFCCHVFQNGKVFILTSNTMHNNITPSNAFKKLILIWLNPHMNHNNDNRSCL